MSVGEASDVTLARKESSAMMAMLQALMKDIKVRMDQHTEKIAQHTEKIDRQTTIICQNLRKIGLQEVQMDEQPAQMNLAAGNAQVREEVVAAPSPVSDQQLCGVTGHCELRVSVADMEELCPLGLDSLFGNAVCEGAVKQVESPVTCPDVEERLELNCGVVRKHEAADATEVGGGGHAAVSSCGDEVNGGAGKAVPVESGRSEAG